MNEEVNLKYKLVNATEENIDKLVEYKLNSILPYEDNPEKVKIIEDFAVKNIPKRLEEYEMIIVDKNVVGCISVVEDECGLFLDEIYLEEEFRGRGIGRHILEKLLNRGRCLTLWVYKKNRDAIRFYEKMGLVIVENEELRCKMSTGHIIRMARLDDVKNLAILKQRVWDETYRGIYKDELIDNFDFKKSEVSFTNMIENKNLSLYVVLSNGELVGYMSIGEPHHPYGDYEQEMGLLYLRRDVQGRGIGRELFNLAQSEVRQNGYDKFLVSCNKYNENARNFYEKMGGRIILVEDDAEDMRYPQVKYHYDV